MNIMVRLYSEAVDAEQKQAMAFELSAYDHKLLKYADLFRDRFMRISVSLELDKAMDLGWDTLAECFEAEELFMKQELIDRYFMPRYQKLHKPDTRAHGPTAAEPDLVA